MHFPLRSYQPRRRVPDDKTRFQRGAAAQLEATESQYIRVTATDPGTDERRRNVLKMEPIQARFIIFE